MRFRVTPTWADLGVLPPCRVVAAGRSRPLLASILLAPIIDPALATLSANAGSSP